MKHNNIAIFIPHVGCKNQCSFCNQHTISGTIKPPNETEIREILQKASDEITDKSNTEIAFFGGSFTAIDKDYMIMLLSVANEFVLKYNFCGIRISTRPDAISNDILDILKEYHVTSIELGAQSLNDIVLLKNDRGHTANDVIFASNLIKQYGFTLGLQMMVGLYDDTIQGAMETAKQIIKIAPQTVRIYPTVILKNTKLANLFMDNKYDILTLNEAVDLCSELLIMFEKAKIKVIKLGLHSSTDVEENMVGGIYHPAFRELCESKIYLKNALSLLEGQDKNCKYNLTVNEKSISKMIGQKKINLQLLFEKGFKNIKIIGAADIPDYKILLEKGV